MLSDEERRALRQLERQFSATETRPRAVAPWQHAGLLQLAGASVLCVLMLLAGSTAGMLAFGGLAVAIGLTWWYANDPATDSDPVHQPDGRPD